MLNNTKFDFKKQKKLLSVQKEESKSLCGLCRGTKLLCGRSRCPVLVKFHSRDNVTPLIDKLSLGGSSPPSVFIGRFGYPKVSIGPLIPPVMGDTSLIDTPELWLDKSIDDIEAIFEKKPRGRIAFYNDVQPHGPSAPLKKFDITNPKYEQHIEKAFYDTDLKARSAVLDLYKCGINVSKIQRAFSVGAFGINKYRRFVPTRWSITAVDSMLGKELMKQTKKCPYINEFRIYYLNQFDNRWIVLMMPSEWQYELIEAWYPNTTWNPYGSSISIFNSYEFYKGRSTYAEIGGCYYAARLAVNELLNKERRQAGAIIMRESHPGYIMPIGVWNVRESVRKALKEPYRKFDTLHEALVHVSGKMDIPIPRWIKNSAILKSQLYQKRLEDF